MWPSERPCRRWGWRQRDAELILTGQWDWLETGLEQTAARPATSRRQERLLELAGPVLSFLEAGARVGADEEVTHATEFLCAPESEALLPCLLRVVRTARRSVPRRLHGALGLERMRRRCIEALETRLDAPEREGGSWSIAPPEACRCALCGRLAAFLSATDRRTLEWPLAKEGRKHVHGVIDAHELPVRHETRRKGSPFTLVLTKTEELFRREAEERRGVARRAPWVAQVAGGTNPHCALLCMPLSRSTC